MNLEIPAIYRKLIREGKMTLEEAKDRVLQWSLDRLCEEAYNELEEDFYPKYDSEEERKAWEGPDDEYDPDQN